MPNWVDNALTIHGPAEELARFAAQAATTYTSKYMDFGSGDMKMVEQEVETKFSFWNFIKPDDNILNEYWGQAPQGRSLAEAMQFKSNHWYDWNVRNWGCKWDASDTHVEESVGELGYYFQTPWSQPTEALEAMSNQYPALVMTMRSIEEQGWGYEYIADQDGVRQIAEWEIPDTHEERMEHIGWCDCEELDDDEMEYMYDDCPKKMELVGAGKS